MRILQIPAFCVLSAVLLLAQATTSLTGTVTDPSGAAVPKAAVTPLRRRLPSPGRRFK